MRKQKHNILKPKFTGDHYGNWLYLCCNHCYWSICNYGMDCLSKIITLYPTKHYSFFQRLFNIKPCFEVFLAYALAPLPSVIQQDFGAFPPKIKEVRLGDTVLCLLPALYDVLRPFGHEKFVQAVISKISKPWAVVIYE